MRSPRESRDIVGRWFFEGEKEKLVQDVAFDVSALVFDAEELGNDITPGVRADRSVKRPMGAAMQPRHRRLAGSPNQGHDREKRFPFLGRQICGMQSLRLRKQ